MIDWLGIYKLTDFLFLVFCHHMLFSDALKQSFKKTWCNETFEYRILPNKMQGALGSSKI